MVKQKNCPVCGSTDISVFLGDVRDYITGERFEILRCQACDVGFTLPQPENMELYYPPKYRRYSPIVLTILRKLYHYQTRRWNKLFSKPGSVLEMGCGDGLMLDALRNRGWNVAGTERTEKMAEFARKNLGLQVYVGGFDEIPRGQKFDLIVLFQVLEHLNDPVATLQQCATLLEPEGKLIIAVPNLKSWQSEYASSYWFHLDVPRHLFHFSPESLRNALKIAGLSVSSISYVSFEHDPYGWIQSVLNKQFGNKNKLTRQLMNLDRLTIGSVAAVAAAIVLAIPILLLSVVSWIARGGAIMQVVSSHSRETAEENVHKEGNHA